MTPDQHRAQLQQWIDQTRRNQRVLAIVLAALGAVSVALLLWRKDVGGIALAITALTGISGFWITGAHLVDFRARLAEVDQPRARPIRLIGGGRRF